MRAASPALVALLASGGFEMADLWEITLSGGSVVRWAAADRPVVVDGITYPVGPSLTRGSVKEAVGTEVAELTLTVSADDQDLINGLPIIGFLSARGLDGANVRLLRAFFPRWGDPATGTVLRFAGRVTSVSGIMGDTAQVTVSSWMVLLNVNFPADVYQTACLNTLFNLKCGLSQAAYQATGTVSAGATALTVPTSLSAVAGYYSQGRVTFTSGPCAGLSRSVRSSDGSGVLTMVRPLPATPQSGDTFTVLPGCDLARSTCSTKFNNLSRHRGFPFVPVPETAL